MRLQTKLFNYHELLSKDMKKKAKNIVEEESLLLKEYQKDQKKFNKRFFYGSTQKEMFKTVLLSKVVFVADFHTFSQNIANFEIILKRLLKSNKKIILGLEMIHHDHQKYLDDFISGEISEIKFLELIHYDRSWRFPWRHYRNLFIQARKEKKYSMIGLNSHGDLKERDQFASQILFESFRNNQDAIFLILFGELHLLPDKLPLLFQKIYSDTYSNSLAYTVIHQNIDEIFSKMGKLNRNKTIVKFNDNEYVIQSAHSWLKYESMLYWHENFDEDPDFDIHEYLLRNGIHSFSENSDEDFIGICRRILKSFRVKTFKKGNLENYNLYDYSNIDFITHAIELIENPCLKKLSNHLLRNGRPFKIPYTNYYCATSYSITWLAYLVGIHLFEMINTQNGIRYENGLINSSQERKFLIFFHLCLLAYLCAKYINPHIKCVGYHDLKDKLKEGESTNQKEIIRKALQIIEGEDRIKTVLDHSSLVGNFEVAKVVGHLFADILFDKACYMEYEFSVRFIGMTFFRKQINLERFYQIRDYLFKDNSDDLK